VQQNSLPETLSNPTIQRDINLFIPGDNYYFSNSGQARMAALAKATDLGLGYSITHHPSPAIGLAHYHVINAAGRQVGGHFFYGRRPPRKEKTLWDVRERARTDPERINRGLRDLTTSGLVGAGFGAVIGLVIGGVGGGAGGTLVAPGVGTVGGAVGGSTAGAIKGAAIGAAVGAAVGAGIEALWDWITD
jgi:hypothetical protein